MSEIRLLITMLAHVSIKSWCALAPVAVDGLHTFSMEARVVLAGSWRERVILL